MLSKELGSQVFLKAVCVVALLIFWLGLGLTLLAKYFFGGHV
jgi:hypothetical protein